jgi:hypothetical protein
MATYEDAKTAAGVVLATAGIVSAIAYLHSVFFPVDDECDCGPGNQPGKKGKERRARARANETSSMHRDALFETTCLRLELNVYIY